MKRRSSEFYFKPFNRGLNNSNVDIEKVFHSALLRNEVPTHATSWMTLENTMISERSQAGIKDHKLPDSTEMKCPG